MPGGICTWGVSHLYNYSSRCALISLGGSPTITKKKLKNAPIRNDEAPRVITTPDSVPINLAIYGDPIVGRALALILSGCGYDAMFLSTSSLEELKAFGGVRLLILTPKEQLSVRKLNVLLSALEDEKAAVKTPILELVVPSEEDYLFPGYEARFVLEAPWPCRIEELKRLIEAALLATSNADHEVPSAFC